MDMCLHPHSQRASDAINFAPWGVEKREFSYTAVGNINWCSHYGEQYKIPLKTKKELPYDTAIPLLGIHPERSIIPKDIYTPIFSAALFIILRGCKQPKCPSTEEEIREDMVHIYNGISLSHKKGMKVCDLQRCRQT